MISCKDLLFEIGVEELPASYIQPAMDSLVKQICSSLDREKLTYTEIIRFSTPRRLAVWIKTIPIRQEDEVIERLGPSSKVAFNSDGSLTKAGEGFSNSVGVSPDSLITKTTDKGDYIAARLEIKGESTSKILQQMLPEALKKIVFPKTMYWNNRNITFARPIRWLLVLYGEEVIDFEYNGLRPGKTSFGNVFHRQAEKITIDNPADYERLLQANFVLCERDKRKQLIREQLDKLANRVNGKTCFENELLEEVTDIVEFPTAVMAQFNTKYLKLPDRIIHSTLAKNQKYFPLYSNDNQQLLNNFIFIANNHPDQAQETLSGNERVVKARLDDAVFYYEEDIQRSIDFFNSKLGKTVFHASLGSIKDKVERITKISEHLADILTLDDNFKRKVQRAASICKFDLTTNMIAEKEFTGLQGYIGGKYALHFGEDSEVALAIEEHYLPLSFLDQIPQSIIGSIISIADKIDTLCGIFGIGRIPSGSNDPFALRRSGNGIVRILYENELRINISGLVDFAYQLINNHIPEKYKNKEELLNFFRQRIEWLLEQNKIDYDVINAVVATGYTEVTALKRKVSALQSFRDRDDFENLILSFKRVSNIISQEKQFSDINPDLFEETAEKDLFRGLLELEEAAMSHLQKQNYAALLEGFLTIRERIDLFFDKVLVNVDDRVIRNNRYALLNRIRSLFLQVADLSLIVIEGEAK